MSTDKLDGCYQFVVQFIAIFFYNFIVLVVYTQAISSSEEEDDEDDEGEEGGAGRNKRKKGKLTASGQDMKALTMCRVLHVSALKVPLPNSSPVSKNSNSSGGDGSGGGNKGAAEKESLFAQIALPRYDQLVTFRDPRYKKKLLKRNRDERLDDARQVLSSKEVIQQVFVQNCALCVMSRYGLVDDLTDIRTPASWGLCDSNTEFVEALHLSGAKTVLHPIWGGDATGLGALAHIVFLIRFYSVLPSNSKSRLSIVETVRQTQLWLRDASADSIIAFIHKAPIPKPARKCIIDELESFVSSSLTPAQQQMKLEAMKRTEEAASRAAPSKFISPNKLASPAVSIAEGAPSIVVTTEDGETLGNRIGGTVKFFSHFLHWGSFTVSGTGASVHHPDLTLNKDEGLEGHISWDDKELNNMSYEASMLRAEGKIGEAKELEKLIRKLRMDRIKRNIAAAKGAGARAGRGILDTLDFLDKKLLDQDSDEISVSDDSEEERRRRKLKKQNKARESDSDEYSVDDDDLGALKKTGAAPSSGGVSAEGSLATATSPAPLAKTPSKKFVPRALELGSMKPEDIAYEKWKSKVGGLNMNVRDPVLAPRRTKAASAGQDSASYEYNMMQKVAEGGEQVETQQDYDARMEQLYAKKDRAKARRLKKAAEDSSGEEGEDSDGSGGDEGDTASAKARRAARRKQRRNAQEDSESEYEASEDEASDEEDGDEDGSDGDEGGLYAQRKKLRKKKAAKKAGKVKKVSRFALALKEVRGGVRSYSSVVKTLTEQVPDRQKAKQLLLDSIAGKKGDEKHLGPDGVAPSEDEDGKCVIA